MRGDYGDLGARRQIEPANGDAMALQNGRKQAGLEAREQRDVAALAGDVVEMLRRVVDLFQEARGVQRRLGQDDDVDILQPRQAADAGRGARIYSGSRRETWASGQKRRAASQELRRRGSRIEIHALRA